MHGLTKTRFTKQLVTAKIPTVAASYASNLTTASRQGDTLTASGTPHAVGSWTELIATTPADAYGVWLRVDNTNAGSTDTSLLLNLGIGAASSESAFISNILCGQLPTTFISNAANQPNGRLYYFPGILIPSGSRISAQCQAAIASDTVRVSIWLDLGLRYDRTGTWQTYGAITASSSGTPVTAGTAGFGTWTEIGTTSADHFMWAVGIDMATDNTYGNTIAILDIGYGPDSSTVTPIMENLSYHGSASESMAGPVPFIGYGGVVSGTKLWARAMGSTADVVGVVIHGL